MFGDGVHKKIPFHQNELEYLILRPGEEFMVLELQIINGSLYSYIIGIDREAIGWIKVLGNDGSRIDKYTLGLYDVSWERTDFSKSVVDSDSFKISP